jgi:hypothetical protein
VNLQMRRIGRFQDQRRFKSKQSDEFGAGDAQLFPGLVNGLLPPRRFGAGARDFDGGD